MNRTENRTTALAVALGLFAATASASPQFPYQGRLDNSGTPVTGTYAISFTVYNAPSGGSVVWGPEVFPSVQVVGGAFSVKLGSIVSIDPANLVAGPLYVAVTVKGQNDATPIALAGRQQLLHTPYASASQQDFAVQGRIGAGGANPGDAGVTILASGPPSNGSTVGVLQLSSAGGSLTADGTSLDSTAPVTLQGHSLQPVNVGGVLNVAGNVNVDGGVNAVGQVTAPNTWNKIYDNPNASFAFTNALAVHVNPGGAPNKIYRIYLYGTIATVGSIDTRLLIQINNLGGNPDYNGWLSFFQSGGGAEQDTNGLYIARTADFVATSLATELTLYDGNQILLHGNGTIYNGSVWNVMENGVVSAGSPGLINTIWFIATNPVPNFGFSGRIVIYESN